MLWKHLGKIPDLGVTEGFVREGGSGRMMRELLREGRGVFEEEGIKYADDWRQEMT